MQIRTPLLLVSLVLSASGCQPPPPAPQAQSDNRSPRAGDYNSSFQTESRRHRHRARGSSEEGAGVEVPSESWTRYDRSAQEEGGSRRSAAANGRSSSSGHHNSHAVTTAPGVFDFYVLNLSWSPEFCHGHPDATECAQHRAFTLHGLWPQNANGTYPEDCSDGPGPANPSQYADIYPDPSLLEHEWQTHGTCSGLGADAFFATARRAEQTIQLPAGLTHVTQQTSMTPDQIITLFTQSNSGLPAGSVAISCGNNYLTAVEVCLDKNLRPESCQSVKTCGATQIRVVPPQ